MVSDALRGFGFNLYTNTNVSDNLYYTLFGINPDGSLLPPTGSEIITNYVTSSLTTLPAQTIQDELYKRLYHNLPYLLKTKGTERGIKALIATYGIPDSILTVREYGGNIETTTDGIYDIGTSEYKVMIDTGSNGSVTGSLALSSSLLSPYATIQYFNPENRLNSKTVEVGFSPADVINKNIQTNQGYFNIDQLIGKPSDQYSSSYQSLVSASNVYFASYTEPNSIWEYIRLLKFYNNTLFKTIKDFIPARANISTGIIVKSHLYERNKYPRHEPSMSFQDYSQSIDMVSVTGSDGGAISGSTYWNGFLMTPNGLASYTSSMNVEKYNGELSGSEITVTNGSAFDQDEMSSLPGTGSGFIQVSLGATYQNISSSVRSVSLLDLDYTSDQLTPINYNAVTYSISESQVDNYEAYTNLNNPFAQVQDYNYNLQRSIIPRYSGSQTVSAKYNIYTPGDQSYGKTAAIDKIKYQYAYLVDIFTGSFNLPNRANAQIKYIIDNNENVLDLTKLNKNIFYTQNIFKTTEVVNVSLFNYNNANKDVQYLTNNTSMSIYEGGWRYSPVLFNILGSPTLTYYITPPTSSTSTSPGTSNTGIVNAAGAAAYVTLGSVNVTPETNVGDYNVVIGYNVSFTVDRAGTLLSTYLGNDIQVNLKYTASATGISVSSTELIESVGSTTGTELSAFILPNYNVSVDAVYKEEQTFTIPANVNGGTFNAYFQVSFQTYNPSTFSYGTGTPSGTNGFYNSVVGAGVSPAAVISLSSSPSTTTSYITKVTDPVGSLYIENSGRNIRFTNVQSQYYGNFIQSGSYNSMDDVVFPFTVDYGDMIKFSSSLGGWVEEEEYRVISASYDTVGSYWSALVDRKVNLLSLDGATGYPATASKYIVQKHLPDETNVILRYNPSDTITQDGLLFPQNIDPVVRDNAGNVVKSLKQQNLLSSGQNTIIFA
jgi:hypothetical protein